jgi:histidyl-tRNA synthetase
MQKLGIGETSASTAHVLVTVMEPDRMTDYQGITQELRRNGINTELYLGDEKSLAKQLQYANRLEVPVAVIVGSNEFSRGEVTIKNLRLGARLQDRKTAPGKEREEWLRLSRTVQVTVPKEKYIDTIRSMLAAE